MDLPLFEDDLHETAMIEPSEVIDAIDMPECLILCFFNEVVDAIASRDDARRVEVLVAAHGEHPIYEIEHRGQRLAVLHPGVGAPLAAGFMEEAIALGCSTVVAVGAAGALDPDLVLGHAVIVASAVRDEGTSFHYLAPSRVVEADPAGTAALQQTLEAAGVPFVSGRTWTTDAMYRETRGRVARRVAEGCVTVEMEASAFIAVARFRGVSFAQLLYAGDSLSGPVWDARDWTSATSVRERLFWHAADACLALAEGRSHSGK
jgi:uridine phosphorylase